MTPTEHTIEVPEAADGSRLDQFLARALGQSRSRVQRRIEAGSIRVQGNLDASSSQRLKPGDLILVAQEPEPDASDLRPEPFSADLDILTEEIDYVVLSKPPGLVVHPGAGHDQGTLAHQLLSRYPEMERVGHPQRPGIVHRLDLGTSGVMVVARTEHGYRVLSEAFSARTVRKRYLAIVYGERVDDMEIELPIGRHPRDRKRMAVRASGRPALSRVRALASGNGLALIEVELHTGRTHQIRVHLKAAKHPLVGDPSYGEARWKAYPTVDQPPLRDFGRPALHAWKLAIPDPSSLGQPREDLPAAVDLERHEAHLRRYTAEAPQDMRDLWERMVGPWPI